MASVFTAVPKMIAKSLEVIFDAVASGDPMVIGMLFGAVLGASLRSVLFAGSMSVDDMGG